ncbi:MAG: pirin family protein [Cyclobacteriaceae bacterium]|nr:pirin family protein [Cyclobacteriaceae bacterium]
METSIKSMVYHSADSRGLANHGWLISRHTFSFAGYYNPDRVNFGALRVLNDDIVKPGMGFGSHPHDNMEIISIPLSGSLAHKDSTGVQREIKTGEVQIMSAGSGLVHSEYNHSRTEDVNFLQIWILPKLRNIAPRYDQKDFSKTLESGKMVTVVSPNDPEALWINQDAVLSIGNLKKGTSLNHKLQFPGNGIYAFLIQGCVEVDGKTLNEKDGVGFMAQRKITIEVKEDSKLLLIEIPKIY